MVEGSGLISQDNLNRLELLGAIGLALLVVTPLVYYVVNRIISYIIAVAGMETPIPLALAGVILVGSILISVWSAFKAVELYYN